MSSGFRLSGCKGFVLRFSVLALLLFSMVGGALAQYSSPPSGEWSVSLDGNAKAVALSSGTAFVAETNTNRLTAVDVSSESEIWSVSLDGDGRGVAVSDGTVFVTEGEGGKALTAVDISSQSESWSVSLDGFGNDVAVSDGTAFVAEGFEGQALTAVDISSQSETWSVSMGRAQGVDVSGGTAFVAEGKSLTAVDISSQSESWSVSLDGDGNDVAVNDGTAFVAVGPDGKSLTAVDISSQSESWSVSLDGYAQGVAVSDETALVAEAYLGKTLTAVDISSQSETWSESLDGRGADVTLYDRTAFVAETDDDKALTAFTYNSPPQFNFLSVTPDPVLIGESVSYSECDYDPDGTVQYANLSVTYGGSLVVDDVQRTGEGCKSWDDIFTPQDGNKWLNATFEVVDDAGAVTTQEINRFLSDDAPSVSVNDPSNQTYWTYGVPLSVSVDASDSEPGEDINCDVERDGSLVDEFYLKEGVNSTYSSSLSSGVGGHSVSVSCSDGSGNTGSDSVQYSVDDFKVNDVSSPSQVYETVNESYSLDYRTGDMIHETGSSVDLYWRDSQTSYSFPLVSDANGLESFYRSVPLVQSNQTQVDWRIQVNYNASKLGGGYEIRSVNYSQQNQEVLWNYYFDQHSLDNGFTQLEASKLNYTSSIVEEKQSTADISVEHTFDQTGEEKTGREISKTSYYNFFDSNLVNFSSETFNLEANYTVSFQGDTRSIVDSKDVQLDKIVLNKASNGAETLKFETRDETNNTLVDADVAAGIEVNNPDQPDKKRFYGFDFSKGQSHSVYLQPSYAEINANIFDKRSVEYSNTDKNYPERRYYLTDTLLDNETTNINLYLLQSSEGSTVRLELLNSDLKPLEGHLIRVERAFPDREETRTVALAKTGGDGFASTFLKLQEQYIFTIFNSEGELVDQIGPQSVTTSSETLEVEDDVPPSFANAIQQVKFTEVQEENQSLSVSYISETDRLNSIYLSVYQDDLFGSELISSDSSEQVQGRLEASGFNTSEERVFYELIGTFGETNITLQTGVYGSQTSDYGDAGIFVSFMMFMALTLSGLFRPSAAIGLGVVSIFVMAFTGLLAVGQTALISLAALAAVLIWRMSS